MDTPTPAIYQALLNVQKDIDAISKERKNAQQGYNFRGIDDIMNEIHPHFVKYGILCSPTVLEQTREERPSKSGGVLIYTVLRVRYTFFASDGSSVIAEVVGEGMDSGDKSSPKATSIALKYAILQLFTIPTKDFMTDPEVDSPEPMAKPKGLAPKKEEPPEPKKPWRQTIWHMKFGNNPDKTFAYVGKTLEEIHKVDPKGLAYWCRSFKVVGGGAKDIAVRQAMDEAQAELAKSEAQPPDPAPDTAPMDTVGPTMAEMLADLRNKCEEYAIPESFILAKANEKVGKANQMAKLEEMSELTLKRAILKFNWFVETYANEQKEPKHE